MSDGCRYLCVMEIEKLENAIKSSGLRPADIVRMTNGDIKLSQASAWLLDINKMSASTKHLLIRLCAEKSVIAPIPCLVTPDIEQMAAIRGDYDRAVLESVLVPTSAVYPPEAIMRAIKEKKPVVAKKSITDIKKEIPGLKTASEIPAKKSLTLPITTVSDHDLPSATPTGFASWGTNMTMKRVGNIVKLNVNDLSYTIDFEKAKSGFLVDGKKYLLSDFKEV